MLVTGTGPLVEPKLPDFPGLADFEGPTMHSARWDHAVDLRGKRVASIGTGASAIQYVPAIAPDVEQLYVFQRTPPWVMPHSARPVTPVEKRVYRRAPVVQRAVRGGIYAARELMVLGFVKQPRAMKLLETVGRRHRERSLRDPALIEAHDARLHRRLQAHPAVQRLVSRAAALQRHARDRRRARGARAVDRDRRRP